MHRFILGLVKGDRRQGDHKNGDSLDYRRHNLRVATSNQNNRNTLSRAANASGYKGVFYEPKCARRPYRARICVDSKMIDAGRFATAEEAYAAYCEAAKVHHGEFASPLQYGPPKEKGGEPIDSAPPVSQFSLPL